MEQLRTVDVLVCILVMCVFFIKRVLHFAVETVEHFLFLQIHAWQRTCILRLILKQIHRKEMMQRKDHIPLPRSKHCKCGRVEVEEAVAAAKTDTTLTFHPEQ